MKIKIIDLLNLVYEKKAPKKILYKYCEYEFDDFYNDYKNSDGLMLFEYLFENELEILSLEVEIIEERPEEIEPLGLDNFSDEIEERICLKIEELVKEVNLLKKEDDNNE